MPCTGAAAENRATSEAIAATASALVRQSPSSVASPTTWPLRSVSTPYMRPTTMVTPTK